MRNIYKYWQIVAAVLLCMTSCALDEDSIVPETPEASFKGDIHVVGAVVDFDNKYVGTKALGSEENDESLITEMTMFIFDANGDIVAQPVTIRNYNTTPDAFLIEIGNTNNAFIGTLNGDKYYYNKIGAEGNQNDALAECEIYVVANSEHYKKTVDGNKVSVYSGIETKDQLLDQLLPVSGFEMPRFNNKKVGFPMIGTAEGNTKFNLLDAGMNQNTVATIPLRKLYSKVTVNIMVNAAQVYNVPKFDLDKWSLVNIPKFVSFRALNPIDFDDPDDQARMKELYDYSTIDDLFESSGETNNATNQSIEHTASVDSPDPSSLISFTFYMPEYLLTPQGSFSYPAGIKENEMQRFKPALLDSDQKAAHVQIKGSYTDHHAVVKQVVYRLYLGQNNYDNFNVLRNQHLVNHVTIKGLTNSTSAIGPGSQDNISIDHRVDVVNEGFSIAMERETLVDAHFEFRPVDIMLSSGSSLEVTVPKSCSSWIAIEMSQPSESGDHVPGKGIRKYFTTDLISELTTPDVANDPAGPVLTLVNETDESQKYRIWVYIDENHDVCDKTGKTSGEFGSYSVSKNESRSGMIQFVYSDAGGTQNFNYNIEQKNLWRIWNGDSTRYYDIEYYEEYLYNYAADDPYGNTTNGMPWGLDGVQLSNQHESFTINETNSDWTNWVEDNPNILTYDFYIKKHDKTIASASGATMIREYAGQAFTAEIFTKSQGDEDNKVRVLTMADQARGAVEYCYNRNKRKSDGSIEKVEWYLPSADELEDIIVAGYSSFKEFQDNYYWTSQPAYTRNAFYYEYKEPSGFLGLGSKTVDTYAFIVYEDNTAYARATKVKSLGNDKYGYASSGLNDEPNERGTFDDEVYESGTPTDTLGYFKTWRQWKKPARGDATTTPVFTDQWYWDMKDGNPSNKLYYAFVNENYFNPESNFGMLQEGYQPRTKNNRVRCARVAPNSQNDK